MDKDFEEWLKQDELFEYYNANPKQQEVIYKDYQWEKECVKLEDIDEWIKWLCNNPELAEKHYPLLVNGLKDRIQNSQPFKMANIIQNLPKYFTTWKTEINNHSGKYREKRIKEQITLLNCVLNEWQYSTEIEQQAVESVSPYLTEQLEYWEGELRLKVKALFQFIEYLHSNIENFNQYNDLINELERLDIERNNLCPENNYKDKLKYDKVQAELESKFKILQDNTANLIKAKARELNICNFDNKPNYIFNGVEAEIRQLKKNFSKEDLPEIFKHKSQYLEYRSKTHNTFLSLQFFFDELDEIAKSLFDYFKETDKNEFEPFETKAIPVNSITEALQGFNKGQTKFILPYNSFFKSSQTQHPQNEALPPQQNTKQKLAEKIKKLKTIWLAEPKLSVEDFIQKGNDKSFWNENLNLTLQRNVSTYGTGKTFLGNVFIAFKGWAISEHLDYKEAGKVFCEVFNINLKETTKEKYKAFSSGNLKQIAEIKRTFGIK